jgi:hypothetical protein
MQLLAPEQAGLTGWCRLGGVRSFINFVWYAPLYVFVAASLVGSREYYGAGDVGCAY